MSRQDVLRIGGACAFWGDSARGIEPLVHRGDVDVLVFDYLAELTMSIMAGARARKPDMGYATDFVSAVATHLTQIAARRIKLLSNAGGLNPAACARALRQAAASAGATLKIAVIDGDDLMPIRSEVEAAGVTEMFTGKGLPPAPTSMHAYLGALPVVAALRRGADVVITGRCADSALALAALMHRFGWTARQYALLAAGSLAGHMLECSTQATGGLYTDWWEVPGWDDMGFPIAECADDGSFVLSKPEGTGGLIHPLVAAEQLLYEVTDPASYLLPDVTCDFTGVTISPCGENRVRISGARGRAPSPHYKVTATWHDGYRASSTLTFVGEHAYDKARRAGLALLARTRRMFEQQGLADYAETNLEVLGSETPSYGANAAGASREVVLRIAARHADPVALEILSREIAPFGTSGAPGTTGFSARVKPQPVFRLFSFLWPKARVPVCLHIDEERFALEPPAPAPFEATAAGSRHAPVELPGGDRIEVPLSAIAVARSGDKADQAHVAVIARQPRYAALIGEQLTPQAVRDWFSHVAHGAVRRYEVPGVHAYNFVLDSALGGGGAASLRNDLLGKTFAQVLLSHPVRIPAAWVDGISSGYQGTHAVDGQ